MANLCHFGFWIFYKLLTTSYFSFDAHLPLPYSFPASMPLIQSAIKRSRQNETRRKRLLPFKTNMKTMLRKIIDLMKEGKREEAEKLLPQIYSSIDTAVKKRILHPNTAARRKARMARLVAGAKK